MKAHLWNHRRGLFAIACTTILFAIGLVTASVKIPSLARFWLLCTVFYFGFSSLVYWLFARRRPEGGPVSSWHSRHLGPRPVISAALMAGPLVSIGFWAFDVYVLSADFDLTPYERQEELPGFVMIGVFVGIVVSALVAGFTEE